MKGSTASLIAICLNRSHLCSLKFLSLAPTASWAAIRAKGVFVALLTKGVVLLARGLTSKTKILLSLNANCKLIRPTTFSSSARAFVMRAISFIALLDILYGGNTHAESPE